MTLAKDLIDVGITPMENNTVLAAPKCNECRRMEREIRQLNGRVRRSEQFIQKVMDLCQQAQIDY